MQEARDRCEEVASGHRWSALLCGSFGNGKTHLAIAALQGFMNGGRKGGWFWKVPDFLSMLRQAQFVKDDEWPKPNAEELINAYRSGPGLIVFDDLGAENATDWASEQLYRIFDSRYDERAPTIITSNQPKARIDGRIISRFQAGLVVCRGRDLRSDLG